jgi:hypothetical protein
MSVEGTGVSVEAVRRVLEKISNREYKCTVIEECVKEFINDLDRALRDATSNYCFVESYDSEEAVIACGALKTIYVELDYDIVEIVRIKTRVLNRAC